MENKAKVYQLIIGRRKQGWYSDEDRDEVKYRGETDPARLDIPTVDAAHQIAKLVGAESYIITDSEDTFGHNPVFVTQDIVEYNNACAKAKKEERAGKTATAARMNITPFAYDYKQYGDVRVVFVRSEVSYNPRQSSNIQWHLQAHRVVEGEGMPDGYSYRTHFDPAEYKTRAGAWRKKAFFKDNEYFIEKHPEFAEVWDDMQDILDKMHELKKRILNS